MTNQPTRLSPHTDGDPTVQHAGCSECGARYFVEGDSCAARFDQLLALDHSRQEPWGSRHGQAFAAFALQHPMRYSASIDRAWEALYRIYALNELATHVFASIRSAGKEPVGVTTVPSRPREPVSAPALTIADLGDFAADEYPAALDAWCLATLRSWGARIAVDRPDER